MKRSSIANVDSEQPEIFIGQGRQAAAAYLDTGISAYRGNPFIEALPPILTEDQSKALMSGHMYINVHTAKYPDGEIRGQLTPAS